MSFIPVKKKTVLVLSGPNYELHLHVILTDACRAGTHLLVNFSSIKPPKSYDPACVVRASELAHPYLTKDSFVIYREIQQRPTQQIIKCVETKNYVERDAVSDELFKRICDGINQSEHIPLWAKKLYNNWPD